MRASLMSKQTPIQLHRVTNLALPSPAEPCTLAVRMYRPVAGRLPVALFLHGGGWVLNDLETHDHLCRRLALRSRCAVVALDYRRAPEHRHPAALEDALLAYRWLRDNAARLDCEPSRVAIIGESAGATIGACLAVLLRDLGAPTPAVQVLAYPLADIGEGWPSWARYGHGYMLDREFVEWSLRHYLPNDDEPYGYLFPLQASDLRGLPPTVIVTAEFDPLRDGGVAYAQKLIAAGVAVEHIHVPDQMHGFLLLDRTVAKARALIDRLGTIIADHLSTCNRDRDNGLPSPAGQQAQPN
jgi:acetyl esterase